jgi:methionine-rich copper-binding protein CopC
MRRGISTVAIVAIAALFSPSQSAHAEMRSPTPVPSSVLEQFKKEMEAFNAVMREREEKIREINQEFNSAINKAAQDARFAMQIAAKPEQKNSINSQKRIAVATAIISRENALIALGQPPLPPQDPLRMQKGMSKQKELKEKNRR